MPPEQYAENVKRVAEQEKKWCGAGPDGTVECFNSPRELAGWINQLAEEQK